MIHEKKKEKPTTRKYLVFCEECNISDQHFMTVVEIYVKTIIEQWCKKCNKITKWAIHFKRDVKE